MRDPQRAGVAATIPFEELSAELTQAGDDVLREFAPQILGVPHRLEIRGHTRRRPVGSGSPFKDNWDLSFARCVAIMRRLEELGIDQRRMRLSQSAGFEPLSTEPNEELERQTPRVELILLDEVPVDATPPDSQVVHAAGK